MAIVGRPLLASRGLRWRSVARDSTATAGSRAFPQFIMTAAKPPSQSRRYKGRNVRAVAQCRGLPSDAQQSYASPYMQQAVALAQFELGMYEVVETFSPAAA